MKALRFYAARTLVVEEIDEPAEPADDEVVIENRFTGICGTDLHEYAFGPIFVPKEPHPLTGSFGPQVLGHEFGGVVKKTGKLVTHVQVGDRVSVQPYITPRNGDYYTDRAKYQLSNVVAIAGLSWIGGGMAQAALLKAYNVYKTPSALTDEDAALVEPTAVAVYACDRGGVTQGDSVLVTGAGPIGVLTLLAARSAGAVQLFLSDINVRRLALAKEIIPDLITIDPRHENVGDIVRAVTEGNVGSDIAFECVGSASALETCVDAVRKQGVVVQVGLPHGDAPFNWSSVVYKDVDIRGSWSYPGQSWPRVMRLIASGQIPASKIVTKTVSLSDAVHEGFDPLLDPAGAHLKILIDTNQ
jgi:(R,R)-butanediol dehydrogenase/meso-butanediol dehydrogenase/diacetyl reductase